MLGIGVAAAIAASAAFDSDVIPKVKGEIASACGTSPSLSVAWDAFGDDASGANALVASQLRFLVTVFTDVCKTPALKPEVNKQIAKIVVRQAYGAAEPIVYISNRTLFVEYLWAAGEPAPDAAFVSAELVDRLRGGEPEAP